MKLLECWGTVFFFLLVTIIILIMAIRAVKENDKKYWKRYGGILLSIFLCGIITFYLLYSGDADVFSGGAWSLGAILVVEILSFIASIVIGIITGIIYSVKLKSQKQNGESRENETQEKEQKTFWVIVLIMMVAFVVIFLVPYGISVMRLNNAESSVGDYVTEYLEAEYNDIDFEIIGTRRNYSYNGIISSNLTGFVVTVNINDENYNIYVKGISQNDFEIYSDGYKRILED